MAVTSVNDTNASTTLLSASVEAMGASFFNDSTEVLYLLQGLGTASSTAYSVKLNPGDFFTTPDERWARGGVTGIWAANASGSVKITTW